MNPLCSKVEKQISAFCYCSISHRTLLLSRSFLASRDIWPNFLSPQLENGIVLNILFINWNLIKLTTQNKICRPLNLIITKWKVLSFVIVKFALFFDLVGAAINGDYGTKELATFGSSFFVCAYLQVLSSKAFHLASTSTRRASVMARWWELFSWMESTGHERMIDGRWVTLTLWYLIWIILFVY